MTTNTIISIPNTHAAFDALKLAANAVGKDKTRPALMCLSVELAQVIATDGRAAIIAKIETDALPCGLYRIEKNNKTGMLLEHVSEDNETDGFRFPDIAALLARAQKDADSETYTATPYNVVYSERGAQPASRLAAYINRALPDSEFVDYSLVAPLAGESWTIYAAEHGTLSIYLKNDKVQGLIMPCRDSSK